MTKHRPCFNFGYLALAAYFLLAPQADAVAAGASADVQNSSALQPVQANAQHLLAVRYANGDGMPADMPKAAFWFGKAAAQGYARSQYNLGVMFDRGDGVAQQPRQAAHWYRKAADQGLAEAQRALGLLYAKGVGVPKNLERAYFWLLLASVEGNNDVIQLRNAIEIELTPQQKAQAQTDARNWKPRP